MRALAIASLSVRGLRNLAAVDLEPGARFNVVAGDNGQGKTNLLEAIYALCTSRSFRASKPGELVAYGGEVASVRASVSEDGIPREQSLGLRVGARAARLDGKRPPSLAVYAARTPVVVFHPGEVALSMGAGAERRRLLDRIALYASPVSMEDLERYTRAMRARQRVLDMRGTSAPDLDEWEALMARHGSALTTARSEAASRLSAAAVEAFARIAAPDPVLGSEYAPSASQDEAEFRATLRRAREADLRRGGATVGPHRDDLRLTLSGHLARGFASQGQHRAIVLSLKSAEIAVVGAARDVQPILLLDDVSSELDRDRTAALFAFLRDHHGQVFLTTTRRELIDIPPGADRRDYAVAAGVVARA